MNGKQERQLKEFKDKLFVVFEQMQKESNEMDKRIEVLEEFYSQCKADEPYTSDFLRGIDDRITSLEEADKKLMKQISELDSTIRGLCDQHI